MSTPLDKPVGGCDTCRSLYVRAMNARGDLGDSKKKLVRHQDDDALKDRYLEAVKEHKVQVAETQETYWAHHTEAHPRQNATPFANLGSKSVTARADLPPVSDMLDMIDDGWTHQKIAEEYGCSQTTVTHRIQASGLAEQRKADKARAARPDGHANRDTGLVDIFASLWEADWIDDALCAQTDPDAFFPDKGKTNTAAKATCMRCEVREQCLESALSRNERFGIYGGKSERERRTILEERRRAAKQAQREDVAS